MDGGTRSTDSPVAAMATIRALVFMCGLATDIISAVDVSTAFLQAEEYGADEQTRYVKYKAHANAETKFYELLGPIYGQRSASKAWFKTFAGWLKSEGFRQGENEPCVFTKAGLTVAVYVDDCLCRSPGSK